MYNGNPGQSISLTRSTANGAFPIVDTSKGETWPILYSQRDRLGPPVFDPTPVLPIVASFSVGAWVFDPRIQVPYTDSWNMSFQRSLNKDTVVEVRYQGNRSWGAWSQEDWNTLNVYETSWLNGRDGFGVPNGEFEKAEATCARTSSPARASDGSTTRAFPAPARCRSSWRIWTRARMRRIRRRTRATSGRAPRSCRCSTRTTRIRRTFANRLYLNTDSAANLAPGVSTRYFNNALALGYPQNYWVLNPALQTVNIYTNSDNRPMNHFAIVQVRRRLSEGLAAQASYTWSRASGSLQDYHLDRFYLRSTGIPHAIQALVFVRLAVWPRQTIRREHERVAGRRGRRLDVLRHGRFQTQSFVLRNAVLVGMSDSTKRGRS